MTDKYKERQRGLKALEIAKAIPRKVIYIPRGITGDILTDSPTYYQKSRKRKNIDHREVLKMLKDGVSQTETARKFSITKQMVSYIKNKAKAA